MEINYKQLTAMQLDALKEVGNIGAGHAATALSQITGRTIMISVCNVILVPIGQISQIIREEKEESVVISLKLLGDVLGGIILIMPMKNALALADIIKHEPLGTTHMLSEIDMSGLKESGSILAISYLRAIGDMINKLLLPSTPELAVGEISEITDIILSNLSKRVEIAFCIETEFVESTNKIKGYFLLVPEVNSLQIIFKALGLNK